jgi:Bacteriophage tail sheath protein
VAFSVTDKAPDVYIDEVQLPGPIPGVGTSTAAFIGPARQGRMSWPTTVTNFDQFLATFGGYTTAPPVHVTHAIKGFFDNGGTTCVFVRVGSAARSSLTLDDRAGQPALVAMARTEGTHGDTITIEIRDSSIVPAVAVARKQAGLTQAATTQATLDNAADAADFRPLDEVLITEGANSERATIASISGVTVTFQSVLTRSYGANATMRVADLALSQRRIRLTDSTGVEQGSYVNISDGTNDQDGVVESVERASHAITLKEGLTQSFGMDAADPAVNLKTLEFTLVVVAPGANAETYSNLSMYPGHSRYWGRQVAGSPSVELARNDPPSTATPPDDLPAVLAASALTGGADDDLTDLSGPTFTARFKQGIDTLERVDEVNILCVPDRTDQDVQSYLIGHCQKMQDRFAILDPIPGADPAGVQTQRSLLVSDRGFAALYYPWVVVSDPVGSGRIKIPPSGHVAGVYARVDQNRGVHKAPANEAVNGALDLERTLNATENGLLNEDGINAIRAFPGQGIRVWGARTIASGTQWRYVNVRRLLLFIEESIQEGTRFAVFEPNDLALWETVRRQVTEFLTRVWRDGALFGATPQDAFRVRVDESLNPPGQRALGMLLIEVVLFPTTPAEFIVFRIIQEPGGPVVQE